MMQVLITGALGYMGGRITQHLSHRKDMVLRLTAKARPAARSHCQPHTEIIYGDILSDADNAAACAGIDCIIHLAALNEIDSLENPERALEVTTGGTLKLLMAAQRAGVKRFIYFSTAHVYGTPLAGHISEKTVPRPTHPYAITHRAAEDFVLAEHAKKNVEGIVLRLSNAVGAPCDVAVNRWSLVVNDLCVQAVTHKKLVLKSPGTQYRDFVSVHNVCRIVEHVIGLPSEKVGDGLFNVGGKASVQIRQMAEMIADRCQVTLGFRPSLHIPDAQSVIDSTIERLDYDVEKLLSTGYVLSGDLKTEIDETLVMCQRSFGQ
ncbi:MAG: SDR family oxidoreductase [Endomicrobiales bacterium]|jgi:UDP-glucose 4-epimerase